MVFDLIGKIDLDKNLVNRLNSYALSNEKEILSIAEKCSKNDFSSLYHKNDLMRLAVVLKCAENTKLEYQLRKIDDSIYYQTMNDIAIWCENDGNKGLKNYQWIKNHLEPNLFKLGRLQFQMWSVQSLRLDYKNLPINRGDKIIYVHIPQGESLDIEECKKSLKMANTFFNTHFSSYNYEYYFCESWLLFDKNKDFMSENSNIIKFMSLFHIIQSDKNDAQAIERIFCKRKWNKKNYSEKTTLQRQAKQYMLSGKKLGEGTGIISKSSII